MSFATVPALTLRGVKGSPLTAAEGDQNLTILRDFSNALSALMSIALNPDGTVKAGSVGTTALVDGAVTMAKMAFSAGARYAAAGGSINAMTVTYSPVPTAYENGMHLLVKVNITNDGPVTINVNSLGVKSILKNGTSELAAGDIVAGQLILISYEATSGKFQMSNTIPQVNTPWATGVVPQQAGGMATALTGTAAEIATIALTLPASKTWVWIKVVFTTVIDEYNGIEFESSPIRHNGNSLSFVHNSIPSGIIANNSDDTSTVTLIAEGVPTGYTTSTMDLEIRAKYPSGAIAGDTIGKRVCYAIGWYR